MPIKEIINTIFETLVSGDTILMWPIFKIIMALLGGFTLYMILFNFNKEPKSPLLKTKFQIISFIIISTLGGLAILRPQDGLAAFPAGLIGWYLVLKHIEGNKNSNGTNETSPNEFVEKQLEKNQLDEMYKNGLK